MIRLSTVGVRAGLLAVAIAATVPIIAFAQTTEPAIESTPATTTAASPAGDEIVTDDATSVEADLPVRSAIPAEVEVDIQSRFNELRNELLDDRTGTVDWWLAALAVILGFFAIVAVVGGYIGYKRFLEIEAEAKNSVATSKQHETAAQDIHKRITVLLAESEQHVQRIGNLTAETATDDPARANQAIVDVRESPKSSLIDKAITNALDLQQQGRNEEAIEKWRAVAHIAAESDNNLAARAWFSIGYLCQQKPKDAILAYSQSIRLKPDNANVYNNRGAAKQALGQLDDAIADYDQATRLKPDDADTYRNRGNAKYALERHQNAIADYDEAIRLNPEDAAAFLNRGTAKDTLGRHEDAITDFNEAIRLNPDYAEAYNNRGGAKKALGQFGDAIADISEAIRLDPDNATAFLNRGATKYALERHEDAVTDYDEAIRLNPEDADVYNNRGGAKKALGQFGDAIADFSEAIRLDPDNASTYYNNRTIVTLVLGRYTEAIADCDEAIRLNPEHAAAFLNRGNAKYALGRHEDAITDFNGLS